MNIDDMPAGRDLDALVAEKLYGQRWTPLPRYSMDIAAAWEVMPRLGQVALIRDEGGGRWVIAWGEFYGFSFETSEPLAQADTAPLAICRAALKAVTA